MHLKEVINIINLSHGVPANSNMDGTIIEFLVKTISRMKLLSIVTAVHFVVL